MSWKPVGRRPRADRRQLLYVIDVQKALEGEGLTVEIAYRQPKTDGAWIKPKSQAVDEGITRQLSNATDVQMLILMCGTGRWVMRQDRSNELMPIRRPVSNRWLR